MLHRFSGLPAGAPLGGPLNNGVDATGHPTPGTAHTPRAGTEASQRPVGAAPAAQVRMGVARKLLAGLGATLLWAFSLSATALDSQLTAQLLVNTTAFFPVSGVDSDAPTLNLMDDPRVRQLQVLDTSSALSGGSALAHFEGRMGLLRAYAWASFPYCCDALGQRVVQGYSNATVEGRFYDSIAVSGASLAPGTPVSYTVNFSISGSLSDPSFESGGFLTAYGLAEVRLRDLGSFAEVNMRWDASRDAPGLFSLTLDTFVGRTISLSGMLAVGASVSDAARLGRVAWADFGHSAGYQLVPSVAGLNTTGASGYDFSASPVPEPGAWALLAAGLLLLGLRRQSRPCLRPPSSKSDDFSAPPTASGGTARR
ncbi:MAG: PEP-CTERM sorting domain-containing protein [Roseateles sp.]|nr:MAG: PEP-CTERM sorting domain-containing protein [Roseateles sp.]